MANKRGGRRKPSPPCWTLPFFAVIFVVKVFFLTDDPAEDEPWYGDNSTDLSVSRVGQQNDSQARELFGLDEDLLVLLRSGTDMKGSEWTDMKGSEWKSVAAIICGALSISFCFLILCAYGDIDKVKGYRIRSFYKNLKM